MSIITVTTIFLYLSISMEAYHFAMAAASAGLSMIFAHACWLNGCTGLGYFIAYWWFVISVEAAVRIAFEPFRESAKRVDDYGLYLLMRTVCGFFAHLVMQFILSDLLSLPGCALPGKDHWYEYDSTELSYMIVGKLILAMRGTLTWGS